MSATRSRVAKVQAIAELMARLEPEEIEPAVGFLAAEPRQGKVGVGWSALAGVGPAPATTPTLCVTDLDAALTALQALGGSGSQNARTATLRALFARATSAAGPGAS